MVFEWILTIILLVYGFVDLALVNQVAAPFLAPVFIFLVWVTYRQKVHTQNLKINLEDMQAQLESMDEKLDMLTAELKAAKETKADGTPPPETDTDIDNE